MSEKISLTRIGNNRWMIEQHGAMLTSAVVYAGEAMLPKIMADQSLQQMRNVACLPGIIGSALAMPDIHCGYGFPIGGVAAFDLDAGVVSPGGVGYDINCGVRLLRTGLGRRDIEGRVAGLVDALFCNIPSGVGSKRGDLKLGSAAQAAVLQHGAAWAVKQGYGEYSDLEYIEDRGCIEGADPGEVSDKACERGRQQLGTLGSGNHFVEIAYVDRVFDTAAADGMGLESGQVVVAIHTGSRGRCSRPHTNMVSSCRTASCAARRFRLLKADAIWQPWLLQLTMHSPTVRLSPTGYGSVLSTNWV
jgi:tRNA-splicing ligase RtcB